MRCILHLFSGPRNRHDALAAKLSTLGWQCSEYDLVNAPNEDLANDYVWQQVKKGIKAGLSDGMVAGPPCNTYTNGRKDDGRGPVPLRGPSGPHRYGLPRGQGEGEDRHLVGLEDSRSCRTV
eukprot:s2500_g4.t1